MRYLIFLLIIGLVVYTVIDCVRSSDQERLGVHPALWILGMVLLAPLGSIAWIGVRIATRGARPQRPTQTWNPRPHAPDDDPEFLWRLEREKRRLTRAREEDLAITDVPFEDFSADDLTPEDFIDEPDTPADDGDSGSTRA